MLQPFTVGQRIEIPVHYDAWMRGARFGVVRAFRWGKPGQSAYYLIRMDHPQMKNCIKLWSVDWSYAKAL